MIHVRTVKGRSPSLRGGSPYSSGGAVLLGDWEGRLEVHDVVLVRERIGLIFGVAKGHYRTAGVGEDAVDGAVVGEVVNG